LQSPSLPPPPARLHIVIDVEDRAFIAAVHHVCCSEHLLTFAKIDPHSHTLSQEAVRECGGSPKCHITRVQCTGRRGRARRRQSTSSCLCSGRAGSLPAASSATSSPPNCRAKRWEGAGGGSGARLCAMSSCREVWGCRCGGVGVVGGRCVVWCGGVGGV